MEVKFNCDDCPIDYIIYAYENYNMSFLVKNGHIYVEE